MISHLTCIQWGSEGSKKVDGKYQRRVVSSAAASYPGVRPTGWGSLRNWHAEGRKQGNAANAEAQSDKVPRTDREAWVKLLGSSQGQWLEQQLEWGLHQRRGIKHKPEWKKTCRARAITWKSRSSYQAALLCSKGQDSTDRKAATPITTHHLKLGSVSMAQWQKPGTM